MIKDWIKRAFIKYKISIYPSWKSWSGSVFESICYKHIDQIRRTLKIDPVAHVGTWRYLPRKKEGQEEAQIDPLFDRMDGMLKNLLQIKWFLKIYSKRYKPKIRAEAPAISFKGRHAAALHPTLAIEIIIAPLKKTCVNLCK